MQRTTTPQEDVTAANERAAAAEDPVQRRAEGTFRAAARPASGAAVNRARAGAELAGERRSGEGGETGAAIKRAAENARRV